MVDRDQHPTRENEIRRAVFGQVDLQTAELEIVSSIYDGFASAILVKGQPRTIALTREYGDAVQLMALIERGRSAQPSASEANAAAGEGPPPVRGEIRVIDGNRCRFIERELEGDKWEVIGPAAASDSETNEMAAPRALPQARGDAQAVSWEPEWTRTGTDIDGDPIQLQTRWGEFTGRATLARGGDRKWGAHINYGGGKLFDVGTAEETVKAWLEAEIRRRVSLEVARANTALTLYTHPAPDALRVAVEAIRAEINAPLSGPTHGAWDRGRIAGLKEALTALQKGGA